MYFLPTEHYIHDLFKQPDVSQHVSNTTHDAAPGSIRKSRGFAKKVTNNPVMQGRRDIAFIGQSDGVPYFKDKTTRSGTICTLRPASLPEGMDKQNRNTHLSAVQPSVYLSWCPKKKGPKTVHHNPKNQAPIITVLCDDLYTLYMDGVRTVDYSIPEGTPGREFICHCVLLLWYVPHTSDVTPDVKLTSLSPLPTHSGWRSFDSKVESIDFSCQHLGSGRTIRT